MQGLLNAWHVMGWFIRAGGDIVVSDMIWLSTAQMKLFAPCFPLSHGIARVNDRRGLSGIIFVVPT